MARGRITVRPLRPDDRAGWLPLWDAYNAFYRHATTADEAEATFVRLCERTDGLFGLVALDDAECLVGLVHGVLHASTWTQSPYCYLEDLFVADGGRGTGAGRALVEAVYAEADARGAARVYWHTQEFNAPARSLYDQLAHRTSFVVYRR